MDLLAGKGSLADIADIGSLAMGGLVTPEVLLAQEALPAEALVALRGCCVAHWRASILEMELPEALRSSESCSESEPRPRCVQGG